MHSHPFPLEDVQNIGENTREFVVMAAFCPALARRRLSAVGVSEADATFEFVRREPPFGLLMATVGGSGCVWWEDGWHSLNPGEIWLSPPRVAHAYRSEGQWRVVWVCFASDTEAFPGEALFGRGDAQPLASSTLGLHLEATRGGADGGATELWAELTMRYALQLRHANAASGGRAPDMKPLWDGVEADLKRAWTLCEVARLGHMSEETLRVACQRATGRSPMEHLSWLRMQRAASLLLRTDWTVARVAHEVGYGGAFSFSAAFKKCMGVSPSQFRAQS